MSKELRSARSETTEKPSWFNSQYGLLATRTRSLSLTQDHSLPFLVLPLRFHFYLSIYMSASAPSRFSIYYILFVSSCYPPVHSHEAPIPLCPFAYSSPPSLPSVVSSLALFHFVNPAPNWVFTLSPTPGSRQPQATRKRSCAGSSVSPSANTLGNPLSADAEADVCCPCASMWTSLR